MTARPLPRWLPLVVAAAWLLLGWAWLSRGAAHPGVPYRPWAFDHHAYSDLLAMGGDRYFGGGRPTPYLDDRVEYPPLLALALWLPSFVSHAPLAYFTASYAFLAACGLAAVALLAAVPSPARGGEPAGATGERPATDAWWLAATPALAYYGGLNWDLFPIALLAAAVLAAQRGRPAAAGALAALGASAKLFPLALVPPALAACRGSGRRPLLRAAAAFAGVWLAVNVPVALAAPEGWGWFWRFNAGRGAENSVWELLRVSPRLAPLVFDAPFLNAVTAAALAAAAMWAALAARAAAARGAAGPALRLGTAFLLVVWIGTNKVWSPQYALWACAAGALAAAPRSLLALHAVVAVVDYHVAFETRASRGLVRYFDAVYLSEEVVRFAAYALLAAWIGRALLRLARSEGAARAGGAEAAARPA